MKNILLTTALAILCSACASTLEQKISLYLKASNNVQLGQSKEEVLQNFKEVNNGLAMLEQKQAERFNKDGKLIEIYYFRSGWQDDGITTDDEFTPYIFENGTLIAIGWTTLGGPKTQGKARERLQYDRYWNGHLYYYR